MHLVFRFAPEADLQTTLKLKVEINTREHAHLFGIKPYPFAVDSDWYQGKAEIASFEPEELFGTKLRALLQRRRNRDLFDLYHGLEQLALDPDKLIACFDHYLALEGNPITRATAEQRMLEKLTRSLTEDIAPLLPAGIRFNDDDALQAFERVWRDLIVRIRRRYVEVDREGYRRVASGEVSGAVARTLPAGADSLKGLLARIGASQTPIREAIIELKRAGVVNAAGRSLKVSPDDLIPAFSTVWR